MTLLACRLPQISFEWQSHLPWLNGIYRNVIECHVKRRLSCQPQMSHSLVVHHLCPCRQCLQPLMFACICRETLREASQWLLSTGWRKHEFCCTELVVMPPGVPKMIDLMVSRAMSHQTPMKLVQQMSHAEHFRNPYISMPGRSCTLERRLWRKSKPSWSLFGNSLAYR